MSESSHLYRWRFGDMQFDEARLELRVSGLAVDVEQKPLQVLAQLLRHAGEVVTKEELFESVWQGRVTVDHVLATAIGKLRKVFGDEGTKIIVTVPRVGYRLAVPVERVAVGRAHASQMDLTPGAKVPGRDHFQLVQQLSPSGSSEVWLAQHNKTGERRVYKFSPDGSRLSSLKREATLFRVLRESLGERDDFVRIIDWNFETAPFFLECEFGGQDLSDWAQTHHALDNMSRDERLAFFVQICDTVSAAHSVGVLHKDLKPGNVLVADEDGSWRTRLTDFGSSRLLEPGRLDELGITSLGLTLTQGIGGDSSSGTPLYLAPELVAGHAPTVQSDVYALGTMLYQILVGDLSRPMAPGWEYDIDDALLREDIARATDGHPVRRLASVSDLTERLLNLAARRKEAERLEASEREAQRAAQELERTRARRPWILASIALLAVALTLSLVQSRHVAAARDEAATRARQAQASTDFLRDVLINADPRTPGVRPDTSIHDALENAAGLLDQRFHEDPDVRIAIMQSLSQIYDGLKDHEASAKLLSEIVEHLETQEGESAPETLRMQYELAQALFAQSDFDQARAVLAKADSNGGLDPEVAGAVVVQANNIHGQLHLHQNDAAAAIPWFERAIELHGAFTPNDHTSGLMLQMDLSQCYSFSGQQDKAVALLDALFEDGALVNEASLSPWIATRARDIYARALVYAGRAEEAEPMLLQLITDLSEFYAPDHSIIAEVRMVLGSSYASQGLSQEAYAQTALAERAFCAQHGDHQMHCLGAKANANWLNTLLGNASDAIAGLREVRNVFVQLVGDQAPASNVLSYYLAVALLQIEETQESGALLDTLHPDLLEKGAPDTVLWDVMVEAIRMKHRILTGDSGTQLLNDFNTAIHTLREGGMKADHLALYAVDGMHNE